jgi:putative spermidine/putrescine transport system permease protein
MGKHALAMRPTTASLSPLSRCYAAIVVLFLVGPILIGVVVAFSSGDRLEFPPPGLSLRWFKEALRTPQFMEGLWNSVIIAAGSAALATLAGTGAAIALNHYRFLGRSAVQALVMLPITLPGIVLGLGLLFMLRSYGLKPGLLAATFGHAMLSVPYVTAMVLAALANYDRSLERASLNLGVGPVRTFFRITLGSRWPDSSRAPVSPRQQSGSTSASISCSDSPSSTCLRSAATRRNRKSMRCCSAARIGPSVRDD